MDLLFQLRRDEGVRYRPYLDSRGLTTIGVGRCLDKNPLSDTEVDFLLANDVARVQAELAPFAWYQGLDEVRKGAVENLAFNLGLGGLLHFPKFLAALAKQDWVTAASELANSQWALQVGERATRLEQQVATGAWI